MRRELQHFLQSLVRTLAARVGLEVVELKNSPEVDAWLSEELDFDESRPLTATIH